MAECYTATVKDLKCKARKELRDMQECYDLLKNKESEYAKDVVAILELYKQVACIYDNAPVEI